MDSCNRADHATRLVHSLILPMTVDPKTCWISYGMVGGTYLGVLGHPVSAILIRPASVKGTCATYPHWMETA